MKKNQIKVIAIMSVLGNAFGGFVVFKGPGDSAGKTEHSEAAERTEKDEHKGTEAAGKSGKGDEHEEGTHNGGRPLETSMSLLDKVGAPDEARTEQLLPCSYEAAVGTAFCSGRARSTSRQMDLRMLDSQRP